MYINSRKAPARGALLASRPGAKVGVPPTTHSSGRSRRAPYALTIVSPSARFARFLSADGDGRGSVHDRGQGAALAAAGGSESRKRVAVVGCALAGGARRAGRWRRRLPVVR